MEPGETVAQCAVREAREETGFECEVTGLVGIYSDPRHVVAYDDGEVRQQFSVCFAGVAIGGEAALSDETLDVRWVSPADLSGLPLHPSIRLRIEHATTSSERPYFT